MDVTPAVATHHTKGHKHSFTVKIAMAALVLSGVLLGFLGVWSWEKLTTYDPLGEYTTQIVDTDHTVSVKNGPTTEPAVYLNESVRTSGLKCVKDGEGSNKTVIDGNGRVIIPKGSVKVAGIRTWVSDYPPGGILGESHGGGYRGPLCVQYKFNNEIPADVREYVERLSERGIHQSRWHIHIEETPEAEDGTKGEPRSTDSTVFTIIDQNAPTP